MRRRACPARRGASCGSYAAGVASSNRLSKSSRPQQVSSRGSATRDTADLSVHRRAQGHVRGRTDLPGTGRARRADRPAQLLGALLVGTVEKGAVGHHDHRDPGRLLRTRRRRETPAGEPIRQPEDVGAPAAPGHPGGAAHGGTDHAAQRLARGDARPAYTAHHRTGSGRSPGAGPGGPAVAVRRRTCWRWPTSPTCR